MVHQRDLDNNQDNKHDNFIFLSTKINEKADKCILIKWIFSKVNNAVGYRLKQQGAVFIF